MFRPMQALLISATFNPLFQSNTITRTAHVTGNPPVSLPRRFTEARHCLTGLLIKKGVFPAPRRGMHTPTQNTNKNRPTPQVLLSSFFSPLPLIQFSAKGPLHPQNTARYSCASTNHWTRSLTSQTCRCAGTSKTQTQRDICSQRTE
jgi:hypothetical protein